MTCFLTGGTGFVGSHVAKQLVARGERVRCLVRPSSNRQNLECLDNGLIEFVEGDLGKSDTFAVALEGCHTLYHVAADYRLWSKDPQELYHSNVEGTRQLMATAKKSGVSKIVYTSTVGALGLPTDGSPGTETTPVSEANMIGHYKRSKFLAEQAVLGFATVGLPVVIVNPSTPVGDQDIKPTPTGKIILDFLNGSLPAYIETGLNLIDVSDVAAGIILAAERGRIGEKYILGNRNTSLCEMLTMLAKITNLPAPKVRIPYPMALAAVGLENWFAGLTRREPRHPLEGVRMAKYKMYFDASKAVKELGLPQSSIENALERAVRWFIDMGYVNRKLSLRSE